MRHEYMLHTIGGTPVAAVPAAPAPCPEVTAFGRDSFEAALHDARHPVPMFALEWCEFCWTLRRSLRRISVELRSVDLDAAAWQAGQRGAQIRAALQAHTGKSTMPQLFVGGQWLGGCTDTLAAWQDGRLPAMLKALALPFDAGAVQDVQALLPGWLQPRRAA